MNQSTQPDNMRWNIVKLPPPVFPVSLSPDVVRILPAGLPLIFFDPRAVGLNTVWVIRMLHWPGPKPDTAEGWLELYFQVRAAVERVFGA